MKKTVLLAVALSTMLLANSVGIDESKHKTKDKSHQKSQDTTTTDEKSRTTSKEKGYEKSQGKESSKSKEKEQTLSKETSQSKSYSKSIKRVIDMQATVMMPEVDYLIEKFIDRHMQDPRTFLEWLVIKEVDLPDSFIAMERQEQMMQKLNSYSYMDTYTNQQIGNNLSRNGAIDNGTRMGYKHQAYGMSVLLMKKFSKKYNKLFNEFFGIYGLPKANVMVRSNDIPQYLISLEFYKSRFYADVSGAWRGNFVFTIKNFFENDLKFFSKEYIIHAQPQEGRFLLMKKSQPIIEISTLRELHYYGDLIFMRDFGGEMSSKNVAVVDRVLDADGIKLSRKNQHNKFDDYFKKLIKLYIEAFSNINIDNKNSNYSLEELQFRVREYLYKKFHKKDDFLERYLEDPSDFWRPRKKDLLLLPRVKITYNDVIFSKNEGIMLNQKISFQIESSDSVQESFNRSMREAKSKKFVESVKRAINQFQRENKQDMARLAMQLANKIVENKNYAIKQDQIAKASTSTDILKNMLDVVK